MPKVSTAGSLTFSSLGRDVFTRNTHLTPRHLCTCRKRSVLKNALASHLDLDLECVLFQPTCGPGRPCMVSKSLLLLDRIRLMDHISTCSKVSTVYHLLCVSAQLRGRTFVRTFRQPFPPLISVTFPSPQEEARSPLNTYSSLPAACGSASCM